MIKFFTKHTSYLKTNWFNYGLDTIVVIVGILIALALNNWTDNRKQKTTEIQLLIELQQALQGIEDNFISDLQASEKTQLSRVVITEVIENEYPWHDSLQQHFNRFLFFYKYTFDMAAYNSIENWGVNNLTSDSIRREIVTLFQNSPSYLNTLSQQEYDLIWLELRKSSKLVVDASLSKVKPLDYDAFIKNKELALEIKWLSALTNHNDQARRNVLEKIDVLKRNIKNEIVRLK